MKVNCIDCQFFKESKCIKDSKNGYNNCKKFRATPVKDLMQERQKLLISKEDPKRLEFLTEKIKNLNGGTI